MFAFRHGIWLIFFHRVPHYFCCKWSSKCSPFDKGNFPSLLSSPYSIDYTNCFILTRGTLFPPTIFLTSSLNFNCKDLCWEIIALLIWFNALWLWYIFSIFRNIFNSQRVRFPSYIILGESYKNWPKVFLSFIIFIIPWESQNYLVFQRWTICCFSQMKNLGKVM